MPKETIAMPTVMEYFFVLVPLLVFFKFQSKSYLVVKLSPLDN